MSHEQRNEKLNDAIRCRKKRIKELERERDTKLKSWHDLCSLNLNGLDMDHYDKLKEDETVKFYKLIEKEQKELAQLETDNCTSACTLDERQNKKRRIGDSQRGEESDAISLSSGSSDDSQSEYNQLNNNLNGVSSSDDDNDEQSLFSRNDGQKGDDSVSSVRSSPEVIEIGDSDSELSADEADVLSTLSTHTDMQSKRNDEIQPQGEDSDDDISFNDPVAPNLNFDESDSEDDLCVNKSCPTENISEQQNNSIDDGVVSLDNLVDSSPDFDCDSEDESDADDADEEVLENIQKYHQQQIEQSPLTMAMQGFRQPQQSKTRTNAKSKEQYSPEFDPPSLIYRGKEYHINRCYNVLPPTNQNECTIAILRFIDEENARCILISTFEETFLGIEGEDYEVDATMQRERVQIYKHVQNFHLSTFRSHPSDGQEIPKWIYEPRETGSWHTFGYFYDRNKVRKKGPRGEIRSLELFAGAGGSLLGYHDEGFKTVMAVERDKDASDTLKANNPHVKVDCNCVRKVLENYENMSVALGRIDHIHFSSPCQDFSRANRHQRSGLERERANLTLLLLDYVKKTSCSTACFENVTGIFDRNNVAYLKQLSIGLLKLGYQLRCSVLKACDYGDPQTRPRVVMLIARIGHPIPIIPPRTHGPDDDGPLEPYVTVENAFLGLEEGIDFPNMRGRKARSSTANETRLHRTQVAPTIRCSVIPFHFRESRCITVREAACLQSFPLEYKFLGKISSQYKQVGNAVPVMLSRAIARSIKDVLLYNYHDP